MAAIRSVSLTRSSLRISNDCPPLGKCAGDGEDRDLVDNVWHLAAFDDRAGEASLP